jgi:hypothetical protein
MKPFLICSLLAALSAASHAADVCIDGQPVVWHPLTFTFAGPEAAETDDAPNPFLDLRLQVEFMRPGREPYVVPGFFDGDGAGRPGGNAWCVRFSPDAPGTWHYAARFLEEHLPFWETEPADELSRGASTVELGVGRRRKAALGPQVFVKPGEVYAVYLPRAAATGTLDLRNLATPATQRWFNPRSGEFVGEARQITGGTALELGPPPTDPGEDWVVLVRRGTRDTRK